MNDIEKEPKQIYPPEEGEIDSLAELSPDRPEHLSLIERLRGPLGRTAQLTVEMLSSATSEVVARAPEFRDRAESFASEIADRASEVSKIVVEKYNQVADGAQDLTSRAVEIAGPAIESAKETVAETAQKTYVEVVKPIGGDVLTALGEEYGVESHNGKINIRPIKLGRQVFKTLRNPVGAAKKALDIGKKTAITSSAKMFVS